jgi:carbonic anhydrase
VTDSASRGLELRPVTRLEDILPRYRGTPIELMLRYHNLGEPCPPSGGTPVMLVSMCMDHRKELHVPNEFAYILRSAGGNLRDSEFEVSYAVAVGGVSTIALLAHTDCGMAHVSAKATRFVDGLVQRAGWTRTDAERHFAEAASRYEIGDALGFVAGEAQRLRQRYPKLLIAPFLYSVEDDQLAQVVEAHGAGRGDAPRPSTREP